jgi:hypothetical protein
MAFVDSGRTNMKIELAGNYRYSYIGRRGFEFFDDGDRYFSYQAGWKLMSRECQLATMLEF